MHTGARSTHDTDSHGGPSGASFASQLCELPLSYWHKEHRGDSLLVALYTLHKLV